MQITSYEDYAQHHYGMTYKGGREAHGPCMFCPPEHDTVYVNGVPFTGEDRFWVYPNSLKRGGTCRDCAAAGRGPKGTGNWPLKMILERLGLTVSEDLKHTPLPQQPEIYNLWPDLLVDKAHARVNYAYWWEKCHWPKEVVDRYKLGWGDIGNKHALPGDAHLIPMKPQKAYGEPTQGWYMSARRDGKKIRGLGSSKDYFWFIETDRSTKTVVLTESEKNVITAEHLGYKNAICTYGSGNVYSDMIEWLWSLGYRRVILMGDTGKAGAHFNEAYARIAQWAKFTSIEEIAWPAEYEDNYDITDLHREHDNARQLLDAWTIKSYIADGIVPEAEDTLISLDEMHRTIPTIVQQFVESFEPKTMLVLATPPGMGKTHALKEFAETQVPAYMEQRQRELEELKQQLEEAEDDETRRKLQSKIDRFTYTAIAWAGAYINQWDDLRALGIRDDLWFDYKARGFDNCENYDTVLKLAEANHDIGRFCHTACPLKERCAYMAQDKQRTQKPITFFRHQNLLMPIMREYPLGIIVDESPTHLWESDAVLTIEAKDLYPHEEPDELNDQINFEQLSILMDAVRAAMAVNTGAPAKDDNARIGAVPFMKLVDEQLSLRGTTLETMLATIEEAEVQAYQPNYITGDVIKKRCVREVVKMLQQTLPKYKQNPNRHNDASSRMNLISGKLELYMTPAIPLPARTPLIVADGTAMPVTLSGMFKRKPIVRRPAHRNPNAVTTIITNSDWTKGELNRQAGSKIRRAKRQEIAKLVAQSDPSRPIYAADLPTDGDFYDSKYVQEATEIIQGLAERHGKLLVVGYKDLEYMLEKQLFLYDPSLKDKVALAHYGALRGTNKYKDWPAVLLIGAYRIPYDVMYRVISMWVDVFGTDDNPISPELVRKPMQYDGHPDSYDYLTFEHPFADEYVNQREKSEMQQSMERIRPHASLAEKFIYVAAGRPCARFVTAVRKKKEFLDDMRPSKKRTLYLEIIRICRHTLEHEGKIKRPSYEVLAKRFGVSYSDVGKAIKRIVSENIFPGWSGK